MDRFGLDDLRQLLIDANGGEEIASLDGELDTPFTDLGYDSLALLELAGRVQRTYDVLMPDEAPQEMATPRLAVDYINAQLMTVGS